MSCQRSAATGSFGPRSGVRDEGVERAIDRREHLVAIADVARARLGALDRGPEELLVRAEERQRPAARTEPACDRAPDLRSGAGDERVPQAAESTAAAARSDARSLSAAPMNSVMP